MFINVETPEGQKHLIAVEDIARVSESRRYGYRCWIQMKSYPAGEELEIAESLESVNMKIATALGTR